jgi:hypothetical protein
MLDCSATLEPPLSLESAVAAVAAVAAGESEGCRAGRDDPARSPRRRAAAGRHRLGGALPVQTKTMSRLACILLAGILYGIALAFAEDAPGGGVAWGELEPSVQELLGAQKDRWHILPPERQRFMAVGAER